MNKKIIQLSTKQCPPYQRLRKDIEKIIDKTPYTYEYISLYNGPDITEKEFSFDTYWNEIYANIVKYKKELGVHFTSFPTIVKQEEDKLEVIPSKDIIKFLIDESK